MILRNLLSIVACFYFMNSFAQWNLQTSNNLNDLNDVFFIDADTGFAVGNSGAIIKTTNGGVNWSSLNSNGLFTINSVYFINSNLGFAACSDGIIIKTINGGADWSNYYCNTSNAINDIYFINANEGFAVGDGGLILSTSDAGVNWTTLTSNTTQNLNGLFCINNQTVFVVGNNGLILKTNNSGLTWNGIASGVTSILRSITFTDADTGYISGNSGKILKTINAGTNWSQKVSGTVSNLSSIFFCNSSVGYACGSGGKIIKTTNSGNSWIPLISGTSNDLNDIHMINQDTGYVVGLTALILKTKNGGLTPATIVSQSVSQARKFGNSTSLKVSAFGTVPISFQWKLNGVILPNKTDSIISFANINFDDEGFYTCEVSNSLRTVVSDSIELTISDNVELVGDSVFLTINNSVGTIQWQSSLDTLSWQDIPNANSKDYAFKSIAVSSGKKFYRAKITDPNCALLGPYYSKIIRNRIVENISKVPAGANFHGGIVFSVDGNGKGLIAAPIDQKNSVEWGCMGVSIPDNSPVNGASNTIDIISGCATRPIAASICDSLNAFGYDDWFLPAQYQLETLLNYKNIVGNFNNISYWSSTEVMPNMSWYGSFGYNFMSIMDKNSLHSVRAVREFISSEINGKTFYSFNVNQPIPASVSKQPISQNKCVGSSVQLSIDAVGSDSLTYQWKKDGQNIPNAIYNLFYINNSTINDDGVYVCEVSNKCRTVSSQNAMVKVTEIKANTGGALGFCGNFDVQINAIATTNHPEFGNLTISWSPTLNLSNATILNPIASLSNSASYTLNVSDINGCSATSFLYINKHVLTATTGGDRTIICGDSVQFDKLNSNFNLPGTTYLWTPSQGLNSDTISAPKAAPTETKTYSLTVTGPYGCSATDEIIITVNPLTVDAGMNHNLTCGDSIQLYANTNVYSNIQNYNFNWLPNKGLSNYSILNPYVKTLDSTKYFITVTAANGCHTSDSVSINVTPFSLSTGVNRTIHCGDTLTLPLFVNDKNTTDFSYQWSPSLGLNNDTLKNPLTNTIDTIVYHITATSPNGCKSKDSIKINVIPFNISLLTQSVLCGDSVQLNPTIDFRGMDSLSYSWSPSTGLSNINTLKPWVKIDSNQNYTLQVKSANGCVSSGEQYVFMAQPEILNICMVTVDSINKNKIIWEKPLHRNIDSVFIYKETSSTNQYNKIGAIPNDLMSTFIDSNSYPSVQSSKYKIYYLDKCGGISQFSPNHKTMHLSINQGVGLTWNLIWEPYEGFTPSSYVIYRGLDPNNLQQIGTTSASSTQYTDLTAPSGVVYYQVGVLSPTSCNPTRSYQIAKSNIKSNHLSGVSEILNGNLSSKIYPNPTNTNFKVIFSQHENIEFDLNIYNATGELVMTKNAIKNNQQINIENLETGLYLIETITNNTSTKHRLIIQH